LRGIVRIGESRDVIDALVERLRTSYYTSEREPGERAFQLTVHSYHRFYIGSIPWRLSFGSWPVMAMLDRAFLTTWIGIPLAAHADRRAIEAVLMRHFPRLARLELDRNAPTTHPIAPSLAYRARLELSHRMPGRRRRESDADVVERRRYYRQYNLDNAGWRAIRQAAEPRRSALAEWFDPTEVDKIVPPPDAPAAVEDPMSQGFDTKALLGLMLWLDLPR
jgi:hypothetical protein